MEKYQKNAEIYEVFNASMTINTQSSYVKGLLNLACKSCQQCRGQCYSCRTGIIGGLEGISPDESEKFLEELLTAA